MFQTGDWLWSTEHRQPCKVVEVTRLWDDVCYHIWLSSADSIIRTSGARLARLDEAGAATPEKIRFALFGARVANLLNDDILLAPVGAAVIPLPHQLRANAIRVRVQILTDTRNDFSAFGRGWMR